MFNLTLQEIVIATHGIMNMQRDLCIVGVSTDTRQLQPGYLYIALNGKHFDGHEFIQQAFEKGAVAVVSEKPVHSTHPVVLVRNTKKAFGDLATYYRTKINPFIVGITGSVGKTSTKEMIYYILDQCYQTHKTAGNLNNDIGLPHTILEMEPTHTACVLEMGMSNKGEIAYLAHIAQPDIGVITNIGVSHIETLGSKQNILEAKLEILEGLSPMGRLVLNIDDPLLNEFSEKMLKDRILSYGINNKYADIIATNIEQNTKNMTFDVIYQRQCYAVMLPVVGMHHVYTTLAGFCVGVLAHIPFENIIKGIAGYKNTGMRQKQWNHQGVHLIADCYNASPDSMYAALEVLDHVACTGRRIAVLGDMLELGEHAKSLHRDVGEMVATSAVDLLICCGEKAQHIAKQAENSRKTIWFATKQEVTDYLIHHICEGDAILFKASRGVGLEQVIQQVTEAYPS